jgi:hypothetical protein
MAGSTGTEEIVIIPLKKPNKSDYTVAKSWRPISLLSTLGKALELVIAGENIPCSGDPWSAPHEPLWSPEAALCRAGTPPTTGTYLQRTEIKKSTQLGQFRCERCI